MNVIRDSVLDLGSWLILRMASVDTLRSVDALTRTGCNVWTPIERQAKRRPRMRGVVEKSIAMMPSYAFGHVDHLHELLRLSTGTRQDMPRFSIFHHHGCIPLIAENALAPLRDEQSRKDRLFERIRRQGVKAAFFPSGSAVRINDGGFEGLSGIVEDTKGQFTLVSFEGYHSPIKIASLLLDEIVQRPEQSLNDTAAQAA